MQDSTLDTSGGGALSFGSLTAATLGGLTGPGTFGLSNTASSAVALSVGNNNASTTYSGILQGGGSLNKIGSGTLALGGASTYTGPTTISKGQLVVDGWLTNSAVSVNGGTLGGSGHLSSVTVSANGQLAPGDALGTQMNASGNVDLVSGSVLDYELDTPSTSDMVVCGSLTLNGQRFSAFDFTWSSNFGPGNYDLIEFASSTGTLGTITSGTIDGLPATLSLQRNDLVLTVMPEPSTATLLGVCAVGLMGWAWRRRIRKLNYSRKMRTFDKTLVRVFLAVALLSLVTNAWSSTLTYNIVNYPVNEINDAASIQDTLSGTIVTDGSLGIISESDIVGGTITLSNTNGSYTSPLLWSGGYPYCYTLSLIATDTQLLLPPTGEIIASWFDPNDFGDDLYYANASTLNSSTPLYYFGAKVGPTTFGSVPPVVSSSIADSSTWVIATVPEPATLTFLGTALLGLGLVYLRTLNVVEVKTE